MMLPLWLHLKIEKNGKRDFSLHLPLFILWLLALPLALIALPFLLLWSLVSFLITMRFNFFPLVFYSYRLCCALKGTSIEVNEKNERISIFIN